MPEERIPKLFMDWMQWERRKSGRPRITWMERVQAAMKTRNLESDQWRNREEWRLVCGRRRQLLQKPDRWMDRKFTLKQLRHVSVLQSTAEQCNIDTNKDLIYAATPPPY